jgi:hypothetical protein
MSGNRKAAEQEALDWLSDIDPSGKNAALYRDEIFPSMDDNAFDAWVNALEAGGEFLTIYYANATNSAITTENNLNVAEKRGVQIYQRIRVTDPVTGQVTVKPIPVPVLHLPVRRLAQTLESKIAVASDNYHLDEASNQVTGVSKASAVSTPELAIWLGSGLDDPAMEFFKYRGGDQKAYRAMERMIAETGHSDMDVLAPFTDRSKINYTIADTYRAMHLDNTLDD